MNEMSTLRCVVKRNNERARNYMCTHSNALLQITTMIAPVIIIGKVISVIHCEKVVDGKCYNNYCTYTQHWKRCYVIRSFIFFKWPIIYLNSDFFIVMHLSLFHFPHFTFAKPYCTKILWVIVQASWVSCSPKLLYFYHQACIVPSQTIFQEHKRERTT